MQHLQTPLAASGVRRAPERGRGAKDGLGHMRRGLCSAGHAGNPGWSYSCLAKLTIESLCNYWHDHQMML